MTIRGQSIQSSLVQVQRLYAEARYVQALMICRDLLKAAGRNPDVLFQSALTELALGLTEEALAHLTTAISVRPDHAEQRAVMAMASVRIGRLAEAHAHADEALRLNPGDARAAGVKGEALLTGGRADEAYELLRDRIGGASPSVVTVFARACAKAGRHDEGASAIDRALEAGVVGGQAMGLLFALGDLLDDAGRYDEAFEAYRRANVLSPQEFDAAGHVGAVEEAIRNWTRGRSLPRARVPGERPVFIVGMPRSGTSLVEQILASHPRVFGGGELIVIESLAQRWAPAEPGCVAIVSDPARLNGGMLDRGAREYLAALARLSPSADRVTDKLPQNFLHLGAISLMFPGARVVHCTRDPMDTCLSCYFHFFAGHHPYLYDLRSLGVFHRAYERLMTHWKTALDLRVLDVPYEGVVADLEAVSRRMVEFIGLPWDAACLEFHRAARTTVTSSNDQVRRPIYASSIGRWRHYEKHLGPLRDALGD